MSLCVYFLISVHLFSSANTIQGHMGGGGIEPIAAVKGREGVCSLDGSSACHRARLERQTTIRAITN